jgi:tetrahydromethanopterin S-methyltransferase subunit B
LAQKQVVSSVIQNKPLQAFWKTLWYILSLVSASIPSVMQASGNEVTKCPVCDEEVTFITPHVDLSCRFEDMTELDNDAHNEHCAQNHPNEPVWNTIPERENVTIDSVEGYIQYTLERSAAILNCNPVSDTSWFHIQGHGYRRLAFARSLANNPCNKLNQGT